MPIFGGSVMSYMAFLTIGEGGMAKVLLAKAMGPGGFEKIVVLKTIRRHALNNPEIRKQFVSEAQLCAQLNHPNLVQVYDVELDAESPCLVMEYLEGKSLHEIRARQALPKTMQMALFPEFLAGLDYAHELRTLDGQLMNVVHRDVSPHNVFLTYDGSAKVLDFGIAKMAGAVSDTATQEVKGKISYMAPEQLMGGQVDRRADIFAVGVMLWEVAVGRRLWDGVTEAALMHRLASGDIPPVPADAGVDESLARIISRAMAARPADRYATALDMRADLDIYLASLGRRPHMREIGEALATAFQEDRTESAARIRQALERRDSLLPKAETQPESVARARVAVAESEPEQPARHRGIFILSALVLLAVGAAFGLLAARKALPSAAPSEPTSQLGVSELQPSQGVAEAADDASGEPSDGGPPGEELSVPQPGREQPPEAVSSELSGKSAPKTSTKKWKRWTPRASAPSSSTEDSPRDASAVAAPAPPSAARPVTRRPAADSNTNCDPPFYYKDGIKTYRPECL